MTNYLKTLENHLILAKAGTPALTIFFKGESGLGKTQLIKDFAKNQGLKLTILNLSAIDASDFTGLPKIVDGMTTNSRPSWFDTDILFLDEINRVQSSDIEAALLSLLVDRKINGNELNKNCLIVSAGNPDSDDRYNTKSFELALKERLLDIEFTRTYKEFLDYLKSIKESTNLLKFYELHAKDLASYTFRRLERALDYVTITGDVESLAYYLSPNAYNLYVEFLNKNLFSFKDLIEGQISSKLETIAEKKVLLDLSENLLSYNFNGTSALHVNKFLLTIRAENKQAFFESLKFLALRKPEKFGVFKTESKKLKMFDGLKDFLDIYLA